MQRDLQEVHVTREEHVTQRRPTIGELKPQNDSYEELVKRHHIRNQAIMKITRMDHVIEKQSMIGEQNHTTTAARRCSRTSP